MRKETKKTEHTLSWAAAESHTCFTQLELGSLSEDKNTSYLVAAVTLLWFTADAFSLESVSRSGWAALSSVELQSANIKLHTEKYNRFIRLKCQRQAYQTPVCSWCNRVTAVHTPTHTRTYTHLKPDHCLNPLLGMWRSMPQQSMLTDQF